MCPACFATAAWMVAGATSTGGLTALVLNKLHAPNGTRKSPPKTDNKSRKLEEKSS